MTSRIIKSLYITTLPMLSNGAIPYNKGYRRDIWSHGTNCMVSLNTTPYSGLDFLPGLDFLHVPSHPFTPALTVRCCNTRDCANVDSEYVLL